MNKRLRRCYLLLTSLALAGGATGMIGDPSGKSDERKLLTLEKLDQNVAGFRGQMERFLDFDGENPVRIVNNIDYDRAKQLIDAAISDESSHPDWKCRKCGEENEGQFAACWNCGTAQ